MFVRNVVFANVMAVSFFSVLPTVDAIAQDKSHYTLFNRTPDALLRDMSTDRPDLTESPFTVDAGRVQTETNLFGYARSRPDADGVTSESFDFVETNVRIGLTSRSEIGIVWQGHGIVRGKRHGATPAFRDSGVGGVEIRGKINLWGNDDFETLGSALALLPLVRIPTDKDNGISPRFVEAGLIVPYAIDLPGNFDLGLNAGFVSYKDEDTKDREMMYLGSAALAYAWSDTLGTYYEVAGEFSTGDPRGDAIYLGTGVTYAINKNLQLDTGVNFGVTDAADRINPFVGVSARF